MMCRSHSTSVCLPALHILHPLVHPFPALFFRRLFFAEDNCIENVPIGSAVVRLAPTQKRAQVDVNRVAARRNPQQRCAQYQVRASWPLFLCADCGFFRRQCTRKTPWIAWIHSQTLPCWEVEVGDRRCRGVIVPG